MFLRVYEVMSPRVDNLNIRDRLSHALTVMSRNCMSCVVVCEAGKPIGIITERDIVNFYAKYIGEGSMPDMCVSEVMSWDPICIDSQMPILDALILARNRNVRHLPVVDEDHYLIGLVTQSETISAYINSFDFNSKLLEDYDALKMLALEDPLLGIGNRRAMGVDLDHMEASARRYGKTYAVAMFDVDYFKAYNDCYGHQRGDDTLKKIADTIKKNIRDADRIYRYGGEEFLLLMPNTDAHQAFKLSERIRKRIEHLNIPHKESVLNRVTVSIGIAATNDAWKEVVSVADQALYNAKSKGRNQTVKLRL